MRMGEQNDKVEFPEEVSAVLNSFAIDMEQYEECRRVQKELSSLGWSCDYGLSGELYDIEKEEEC
jgi:hypothetical protein